MTERDGILEGRQRWRRLLFLHWAVAPEAVRPTVPKELALDLREGMAWVGVVALDIEGARPPFAPAGVGLDFLETNARTYVRLPGGPPAVWFFSLDAASRLAVAGARLAYGLPYEHARMAREREDCAELYRTVRRGPRAPGLEVRYRVGREIGIAARGSLDAFLIERYALHTVRRGRVGTVRVVHAPYPLREVEVESVSEDLLAAAGIERPDEPPLARWSDGVDVEVRRLVAVPSLADFRARSRPPLGEPAPARYLSRI
jgi:uncharacterized protein YqjF (DUF2071 family)